MNDINHLCVQLVKMIISGVHIHFICSALYVSLHLVKTAMLTERNAVLNNCRGENVEVEEDIFF